MTYANATKSLFNWEISKLCSFLSTRPNEFYYPAPSLIELIFPLYASIPHPYLVTLTGDFFLFGLELLVGLWFFCLLQLAFQLSYGVLVFSFSAKSSGVSQNVAGSKNHNRYSSTTIKGKPWRGTIKYKPTHIMIRWDVLKSSQLMQTRSRAHGWTLLSPLNTRNEITIDMKMKSLPRTITIPYYFIKRDHRESYTKIPFENWFSLSFPYGRKYNYTNLEWNWAYDQNNKYVPKIIFSTRCCSLRITFPHLYI